MGGRDGWGGRPAACAGLAVWTSDRRRRAGIPRESDRFAAPIAALHPVSVASRLVENPWTTGAATAYPTHPPCCRCAFAFPPFCSLLLL